MSGVRNKLWTIAPVAEEHQQKSKKYFHWLVAYIMTIVPYFLQNYVEKIVLQSLTLHEYLEQKKHSMFHMFDTKDCCECIAKTECKKQNIQKLTKVQFTTLYEMRKHQNAKCTKSMKRLCPCVITVNNKVKISTLDITLISCIFEHDQCSGAKLWIETIRDIRNGIFHLGDPFRINKPTFEDYWKRLSGSVGGIANLLGCRQLLWEEEIHIMYIKINNLSNDQILNAQAFLTEEYQRKYQELELQLLAKVNESVQRLDTSPEKEQLQFLFKTVGNPGETRLIECANESAASAYHRSNLNNVKINVSGNERVTRLIGPADDCIVSDMQTVLLYCTLDVPIYWDEDELFNAIEKVIKFHNEGQRKAKIICITTGGLNITVEIVRRVLKKIEELEFEIAQLVSDILESSNIDVSRKATLNLNLLDSNVQEYVQENVNLADLNDQGEGHALSQGRAPVMTISNLQDKIVFRGDSGAHS